MMAMVMVMAAIPGGDAQKKSGAPFSSCVINAAQPQIPAPAAAAAKAAANQSIFGLQCCR